MDGKTPTITEGEESRAPATELLLSPPTNAIVVATAASGKENSIGKKRPRRSPTSSIASQEDGMEESIDDNTIDGDSKMTLAQDAQQEQPPEDRAVGNCSSSSDHEEEEEEEPPVHAMGVSLPWFERGGPLLRRPPSLLWDPHEGYNPRKYKSFKTKATTRGGKKRRRGQPLASATATTTADVDSDADAEEKRHTIVTRRRPIHVGGWPVPPKVLGVCAECGIAEEEDSGGGCRPVRNKGGRRDAADEDDEEDADNGNTIVLCDGPGCNREFHLKCCRPPLREVPEGSYYCFDCQPGGGYSTQMLEEYLDETEGERDSHHEEFSRWQAATEAYRGETPTTGSGDAPAAAARTGGILAAAATPPARRKRRVKKHQYEGDSLSALTPNRTRGNGPEGSKSPAKRRRIGSSNSVSDKFTFVDKLVFRDMEESQPELLSQMMNGICSDVAGKGPPRSELEVFHRSKPQKQSLRRDGRFLPGQEEKDDEEEDSILVGCAVRLYCPKSNHYHTGRILKLREPPCDKNPNEIVREDYNRNHDTECLVRFPAGRDYRKKSLTRWIRLEEHSLAVACPRLVWGKFEASELEESPRANGKKKSSSPASSSKDRWVPTKLWMRSSRELVMSMSLLEESLGQISYRGFRQLDDDHDASTVTANGAALSGRSSPRRSSPSSFPRDKNIRNGQNHQSSTLEIVTPNSPALKQEEKAISTSRTSNSSSKFPPYLQQKWMLAECIGREIYKLVHVATETKEYAGGNFSNATASPKKNGSGGKKSTKKGSQSSNGLSTRPRENEIMFALVQAENEERKRVQSWNRLPLQNSWHEKALTCLDEYALGPLAYDNAYKKTVRFLVDDCETLDDADNDEENLGGNHYQRTFTIQPTPLVRTGLDRMHILNRFVSDYNRKQADVGESFSFGNDNVNSHLEHYNRLGSNNGMLHATKDLAMSLSCDLVSNHSITACIQQQNRMARIHLKDLPKGREQQANEKLSEELSIEMPPSSLPTEDATEAEKITHGGEHVESIQDFNGDHDHRGDDCAEESTKEIGESTTAESTEIINHAHQWNENAKGLAIEMKEALVVEKVETIDNIPQGDGSAEAAAEEKEEAKNVKSAEMMEHALHGNGHARMAVEVLKETRKEEKAETIIPIEKPSRNIDSTSQSKSPTSSTGILPLIIHDTKINHKVKGTIPVPSPRVETTTLISQKGSTSSATAAVTPSMSGPEILLSKENTSAISKSVPAPS